MKHILKSNRGEGSLGTGVKIIIAVVIGALVLGGLFALWKTVLLPKMQTRVEDMMDVNQNTAVQIRCVANDSGASVLEYSYDGNTWLSVPMTNFSADAEIKAYYADTTGATSMYIAGIVEGSRIYVVSSTDGLNWAKRRYWDWQNQVITIKKTASGYSFTMQRGSTPYTSASSDGITWSEAWSPLIPIG